MTEEDFSYKDMEREVVAESIPEVTEKDIKFVIDTICKEARYDRPSVRQLFFGMCTAFTRLGMGHKVNSRDAGAGKSYILNKVSGYFPDKYVLILGGASNKAFQHMAGKMVIRNEETGELEDAEPQIEGLENELEGMDPKTEEYKETNSLLKSLKRRQQKLINLDNLIIEILDTPQEGLLSNLMSLVSQDGDRDQEYMFVNDKFQGTSNIMHGMPVIFYTRVLDDSHNTRAEEVFRRFVNVTPVATKEKVREANKITFKRFGLLAEEFGDQVVSKEDKQKARAIVSNVVERLKTHTSYFGPKESGVRILFEEALGFAMPDHNVFEMTVSDRMARYLAIIAKVNQCSRPRVVHRETGAFYPIPTFGDLRETFSLMEMGGSNIRPYLVVMYNEVIFPLYSKIEEPRSDQDVIRECADKETYKGLRVQEIIDGAKEELHFTISAKEMYNKYLTPMAELGLINWQRSELKGNEKIFMPSDPEASKSTLRSFQTLTIRD